MIRKLFYILLAFTLYYFASISISGCAKEYSYEGGPGPDTTPSVTDTPPPIDDTIALDLPVCDACKITADTSGYTWNFEYNSNKLCGNITDAVITPDRHGFTFFGPSACSLDTGIVFTVYLKTGDTLNRDRTNVFTDDVYFEYYDNISDIDVFASDLTHRMGLTITNYDDATGTAIGTFSGVATSKLNTVAIINSGNFIIKFR
jgi:hypothetical protein